ncbi:MAG: sel1 repeat family protein, partial [Gammaproteobacteria bacterium]
KWYMKAAEQGHSGAQNNIGAMYDSGVGVLKNKSRGYMFFYMASLKGEQVSIKNLALIRSEMSPQQLKLAEEYIAKWMESFP